MAEKDPFWEIVADSGMEESTPDLDIALTDLASVLQSASEASSWISHYLMNSIEGTPPKVPSKLYTILAVLQTAAREIITHLAPCTCPICRPTSE